MTEKIKVTVRNKTAVHFDSDCLSISMLNGVGPFDILPEHANFISIVSGEIIINELSGKQWKHNCVRGVARAVNNVIDVVILEESN